MARRKDHSPEQLEILIREAAKKLIQNNGLKGLTARALAKEIGYTPGTIYNVYKDMDALILVINFETLGRLYDFCLERIGTSPADFTRIKALAYAYVDFAHENIRAWGALFANTRVNEKKMRLPQYYQSRLLEIFQLIESVLIECSKVSQSEAPKAARLLWSCLHGITVLTLDGRLTLIGVDNPHHMIDDLLEKYIKQ